MQQSTSTSNSESVAPKAGLGSGLDKPILLPLVFSTKSRVFGDNSATAWEPTFKQFKAKVKPEVLARDSHRCAFCGYRSDSNDVHHLTDVHLETPLENLCVADRLCHGWHHLGELAEGEAVIAYLPGLTPQDVNHLQRTIMVAMADGDEELKGDAKRLLNWLASHQEYTKYAWGTSSPKVFSNALVRNAAADRSARELVFQGLAVVFNPGPLKDQVTAWSKGLRVSSPPSSWGKVYHSVMHATV